jgi:hypothetical protein
MSKLGTLFFSGALTVMTIAGAAAQSSETARFIALGDLLKPSSAINRIGRFGQDGGPIPGTAMSIRGGLMVTPRGGGMAGVDFSIPSISLGAGWHGRVDADVIFKANFGGVDTIIPVTFDQLYFNPAATGGHAFYWGGGLGAILGGPGVFDAKLILGVDLTSRFGAEMNVHFTEGDTILTLLARFHL